MESLADVLRAGRARVGLSQQEVGQLTGQTGSAIGNYERGERVPSTLVLGLLARVLPLERSMAELQALRKASRQQKAQVIGAGESDAIDREVAWLKHACQSLSDQVEQLTEAVEYLERERAG